MKKVAVRGNANIGTELTEEFGMISDGVYFKTIIN